MITFSVTWCTLPAEDGHVRHRGWQRVVQGDVAAGPDEPEHEGVPIAISLESPGLRPRLEISPIGLTASPSVRLSADATAELVKLLSQLD